MDKQFLIENRKKLMAYVPEGSIVLLFSGSAPHRSADSSYYFSINRNFYYITGIERENVIFFCSKLNGKTDLALYIDKPDSLKEAWLGKMLDIDEAAAASGIENIKYKESFEKALNTMLMENDNCSVYLDIESSQWNQPLSIEQKFAKELRRKFPHIAIKSIYNQICEQRVIKAPEEIENIKKAINITYEGIKSMMAHVKPGMMEYELEAYYDYELKRNSVKHPGFDSIIASGVNAAVLHYESNNSKVKDSSLVLCDVGAEWGNYSGDLTRTFPSNGKFTKRQKEIYDIVLGVNLEVIKAMKPGVPYRSLNELTKKILSDNLKKLKLIKDDSELTRYYFHSVTHYLGLDTHDVGSRDTELKPGMVLTVEPGLYIKDEGIGVRIEDDVLITKDGCEVLSKNTIKTTEEIENFMSK